MKTKESKIEITLCDKKLVGNIPMYKFKIGEKEEAADLVYHWLSNKNFNKSVFVCFNNFRDLPIEELRDEHISILVSHSYDDITDFFELYMNTETICFSIFEFESYQEAFRYCIDLKEMF